MKLYVLASAGLAAAAPSSGILEKRQGGCKYGFVFARGSTEPSPIGILIGPNLKTSLSSKLPGLSTFPVGYAASIATNVSNDRTDEASKKEGVKAFQKAKDCQVIVAGGYSQGAAVMHNVVGTVNGKKSPLDQSIRNKIAGVALFGDTRNKQDGGHIKDFPAERSKVWCNSGDGVCGGALNVNAGHLAYSGQQINEAATYLANLAKSFKPGQAPEPSASGGDDAGSSSGGGAAPKGKGKGLGGAGGAPKGKGGKGGMPKMPPPKEEPASEPPKEEPAAEAPKEEPAAKGKKGKAAKEEPAAEE